MRVHEYRTQSTTRMESYSAEDMVQQTLTNSWCTTHYTTILMCTSHYLTGTTNIHTLDHTHTLPHYTHAPHTHTPQYLTPTYLHTSHIPCLTHTHTCTLCSHLTHTHTSHTHTHTHLTHTHLQTSLPGHWQLRILNTVDPQAPPPPPPPQVYHAKETEAPPLSPQGSPHWGEGVLGTSHVH